MPISNLERFRKDVDRLVKQSRDLQLAMIIGAFGKSNASEIMRSQGVSEQEIDKAKSESGAFGINYQGWYSECLALIKQLLPDRLQEFKALYERPPNRKEVSYVTYVIADFPISLQTSRGGDIVADSKAAIPKFQNQIAILTAARTRFESSLYDIRQLVQSDLFDSEIESARELLKKGFLRAAGAIAGVVLEKHLKQVCADHNIKILKKNPGISDLNELLKSSEVIDIPQWRFIGLLADYRNVCDHNKSKEPTPEQVSDLIEGTDKVLKTII